MAPEQTVPEEILAELVKEGKLTLTRRGKYMKGDNVPAALVGTFISNSRGFGFVEMQGETEDVFIGEEYTGGALDGDMVEFAIVKEIPGKKREGKIVKILSRGITRVVGYYQITPGKNYGFVIPDNQKFNSIKLL